MFAKLAQQSPQSRQIGAAKPTKPTSPLCHRVAVCTSLTHMPPQSLTHISYLPMCTRRYRIALTGQHACQPHIHTQAPPGGSTTVQVQHMSRHKKGSNWGMLQTYTCCDTAGCPWTDAAAKTSPALCLAVLAVPTFIHTTHPLLLVGTHIAQVEPRFNTHGVQHVPTCSGYPLTSTVMP